MKKKQELFKTVNHILIDYILDNYPHIYNTTNRTDIKLWVEKYLESKK